MKTEKIDRYNIELKDLGKKKSTTSIGNYLWVKKYDGGVAIRVSRQGELILPKSWAGELSLILREFSSPRLYTSIELSWIMEKFKYSKDVTDFVQKIMNREIKTKHLNKIRQSNETKGKILKRMGVEE